MTNFEAFILGIIQGLTEFLPVSSSGHLEIGKALLGVELQENLSFTVVVHAATVCSTIIVYRKDIGQLIGGLFKFSWNAETRYFTKILLSAIPVLLVGLFLKDQVEALFSGKLLLVGAMLLVTGTLLGFTFYAKARDRDISFKDAFIIGIAQALAVIPGISRSGATIATSLLLKNRKSDAARFSFLMVLLPILGMLVLDLLSGDLTKESTEAMPLIFGFISSFIFGLLACSLMIRLVKQSKLIYFAMYCAIVGLLTLGFSLVA